jgi:hypothetical protein
MENRQRHPLSAILLVLFSVQLLLPLVFSLSVTGIRNSQEAVIEQHRHDKTFFAKIKVSDIAGFTQDEKEFIYNDTWYDAEGFISENGETYVLAIADKKETDLVKLNNTHFNRSEKKQSTRETAPFFTFLYYEVPHTTSFFIALHDQKNYNIYSPSKTVNYVKDCNPPPRA